jgi:signal transduction histidine kinase
MFLRVVALLGMLLGTVGYCRADATVLDSLELVLDTTTEDSHRIAALLALTTRLQNQDPAKSLEYGIEALTLAEAGDDTRQLARARMFVGENYVDLGAGERSMNLLLEAMDAFKTLDDTAMVARVHVSISLVHIANKNYESALSSLKRAEKLYIQMGSIPGLVRVRHNEAVVFHELDRPEEALAAYRANLSEGAIDTDYFYAATYNNMGNLFVSLGEQLDSAFHYLLLALEFKEKIGYKASIANTRNNLAEAYMARGQYQQAQRELDIAEALLLQENEPERLVENYEIQSRLAHEIGQSARAYDYLLRARTLSDSIFSEDMANRVTQLSAAYDAEARQAEIDLLQSRQEMEIAENDRFRMVLFALIGGFIMLGVLFIFSIIRSRERNRAARELLRKNKQIEAQQEEILKQNEELQAQNQRLEELNGEKDGLIGIVAHDIRAPLNRSAALAELIATVGPLTPEQKKFVDMIGKVSEDGGRLIQDLLELNAYERKGAVVDWAKVDGNHIIEKVYHGFEANASRKQLALQLLLPPDRVSFITDEKLLTRVLDNLTSNAVKFTHPGRAVYLSMEKVGEQVCFSVRDEGPGMSEADRKKMFRKFQRLTARPTGGESSTGLGLSIVKTLVERLEGTIEVKSEVGVGTTFSICFPIQPQGARIAPKPVDTTPT